MTKDAMDRLHDTLTDSDVVARYRIAGGRNLREPLDCPCPATRKRWLLAEGPDLDGREGLCWVCSACLEIGAEYP